MDTVELLRIVEEEGLDKPVFYPAGRLVNDAVVFEHDGSAWKAYLLDERAGPIHTTVETFESQSDALDYVLLKLRQRMRVRQAMEPIRVRHATNRDFWRFEYAFPSNFDANGP